MAVKVTMVKARLMVRDIDRVLVNEIGRHDGSLYVRKKETCALNVVITLRVMLPCNVDEYLASTRRNLLMLVFKLHRALY